MASGLIDIMKRASLDAADNAQMCDLRFGTVTSTSPLKVKITNQFILPSTLLIVPQHLTNYTVSVGVNWNTSDDTHSHAATDSQGGGCSVQNDTHSHSVSGTKTMTIYNALKTGDKVALIRKTGGQAYYILDRI